jgi:hypothetical protein
VAEDDIQGMGAAPNGEVAWVIRRMRLESPEDNRSVRLVGLFACVRTPGRESVQPRCTLADPQFDLAGAARPGTLDMTQAEIRYYLQQPVAASGGGLKPSPAGTSPASSASAPAESVAAPPPGGTNPTPDARKQEYDLSKDLVAASAALMTAHGAKVAANLRDGTRVEGSLEGFNGSLLLLRTPKGTMPIRLPEVSAIEITK